MISSLAKSLCIRGVITLMSVLNLLAAPEARAGANASPTAFRAEQMSVNYEIKDSTHWIMQEQPTQAATLIISSIGN